MSLVQIAQSVPKAERPVRSINLSIARSCFTRCPGCYNQFGKGVVEGDVVLDFLKVVRAETPLREVTIAGGDPLSRSDIVELVWGIKRMDFAIKLDTVGTAFLSDADTIFFGNSRVKRVEMANLKGAVDILGIPYDGSTSKIAGRFRHGRPNLIEEQDQILSLADEIGFPICANTVVSAANVDDLENIYLKLLKHPSVFKWQLFQFMPIAPLGFANRRHYAITDERFKAAVEQLKLSSTGSSERLFINPKDCASRKNRYLLVDNDGWAYTPVSSDSPVWESEVDATPRRNVLGNIGVPSDVPRIVRHLFWRQNVPMEPKGEACDY